jgi:hypothetical protein
VSWYRLHDTTGNDLGLIEHPALNVEPGDEVVLADDQENPPEASDRSLSRAGWTVRWHD